VDWCDSTSTAMNSWAAPRTMASRGPNG
jgi:hypothetical protein